MSKSPRSAPGNLSEIQALVDKLADDLGRSVAVDNASFELVCASAQIGLIDERRIAAIIDRAPPLEPVPWMLHLGIQDAESPVRLPANSDLHMRARVCFPIRRDAALLGYLWLFDEPAVTDQEIEQTIAVVTRISEVMANEEDDLRQRAEIVRRHTTDIIAGVDGALEAAHTAGLLPDDGDITVHVVRIADGQQGHDAPEDVSPPRHLQVELSRGRTARPFLSIDYPGVLTVVERSGSGQDTRRTAAEVVRAARVASADILNIGTARLEPLIGFDQALRRARFAADLASLLQRGSDPLAWNEIGTWRLLFGWSLSETTVGAISEDAEELLGSASSVHWRTVLAYLDNARNTTATSQELHIHRATLHYRLERVRERLGDRALDDGWRANAVHIALRLHAALQHDPQSTSAKPNTRA